jgi:hypothetical protein
MPSISETSGAKHQLAAGLATGLQTLSENQQIQFTQYTQVVLPLDGYVFWMNTGQTVTAQGSLHQSIDQKQNEDETLAVNRIVFTSLVSVDEFNDISPTTIYIGTFNGVRFSFNRRGPYYQQSDLFHYVGDAIYPALASQVIDSPSNLPAGPVVSNSLPVWLALNRFMPMYPSFLLPANLEPPYAAVHIDPADTEALASAPLIDRTSTHTQLTKDRVRITMYGLSNSQALDFQDYVFQYITNNDNVIGLMNMPIMRDEKRTQSELNVIAMKKTFELDVSYYQTRINTLARQLITDVIAQYFPQPYPY